MVPMAFLWVFLLFIGVGVPIAFALLMSPAVFYLGHQSDPVYLSMLVRRTIAGVDQFPVMAIPFFILAGELMNRGGITRSLVDLAELLVGSMRGALAQVNILTSILFAGLSGSAVADTTAVGSVMIPAMEREGYSRGFSAAVTAASSVIGPILPPSGLMILYAFVMNVSVAAMFAAGVVPGLLVGAALMVIARRAAVKHGYGVSRRRFSGDEKRQVVLGSVPALLAPGIVLGGTLSGVFTPTEAAAVAVGYALIVSLFVTRRLKVRELPSILASTGVASAAILLLVGAATAFGSVASLAGVATRLSELLFSFSENPLVLLFGANILLLAVGMFLDAGPAIVVLGPILAPALIAHGVDPLHFAIVMCVNVTVGLATPPVGLVLFAAAGVASEKVEKVAKEMLPFLAAQIAVIFLITYVPALTLTLPTALGLYGP